MTDKQRQAYEWAKNQSYQSVAAQYAKELAGLVDELQAALRAQQQPNAPLTGWISVKDRLPEIGVEVLICDTSDSNDFVDVWSLERDEEYDDVCWEGKDGCWYPFDEVSHWMPLQKLPEVSDAK